MRQREVGSRGELKRLVDLRVRAREMRKAPTPAEMILWETLRDRKILDRKFRRQFALDCFIPKFSPLPAGGRAGDGRGAGGEVLGARRPWRPYTSCTNGCGRHSQ